MTDKITYKMDEIERKVEELEKQLEMTTCHIFRQRLESVIDFYLTLLEGKVKNEIF